MLKLEEDYSYIELQRQLKSLREQEKRIDENKKAILHHINAIKSEYYKYEVNNKNDL